VRNPAGGEETVGRFIPFHAAGEAYCVGLAAVTNIVLGRSVRPDPDADGRIGRILGNVPVFDLARQLGRATHTVPATSKVLIFAEEETSWGLRIDRVTRSFEVAPEGIFRLPLVLQRGPGRFFESIVTAGGAVSLGLSPRRFRPQAAGGVDAIWEREWSGSVAEEIARASRAAPAGRAAEVRRRRGPGAALMFRLPNREHPLAATRFCVSVTQVADVMEAAPPIRVPGAQAAVEGMINWRNRPVSLIDLGGTLGSPSLGRPAGSWMLILRGSLADEYLAIAVEPGIRFQQLPLAAAPQAAGESLSLLDVDTVLSRLAEPS
jgi:chemotaxis signal transduction protein